MQVLDYRQACGLCLESKACFGEMYDLEVMGKVMPVARFTGGCLCPETTNASV